MEPQLQKFKRYDVLELKNAAYRKAHNHIESLITTTSHWEIITIGEYQRKYQDMRKLIKFDKFGNPIKDDERDTED